MPMNINMFYSNFKTIKLFVQNHEQASQELKDALARVEDSFKTTYNSDSFKEALMANAPIPDDLEERITSAYILYNNEKARL